MVPLAVVLPLQRLNCGPVQTAVCMLSSRDADAAAFGQRKERVAPSILNQQCFSIPSWCVKTAVCMLSSRDADAAGGTEEGMDSMNVCWNWCNLELVMVQLELVKGQFGTGARKGWEASQLVRGRRKAAAYVCYRSTAILFIAYKAVHPVLIWLLS